MYKTIFALTVLLLSGTFKTAVADDKDAEQLKESLAKWVKVREGCGGDYRYTVNWSSAFGFGHRTTITVKGNKVVERKFEEFGRPAPIKPGEKPADPKPKWVETGKTLGTHKEGAPVRTVDEMYEEAKMLVTAKLADGYRLYVKFDKQGLLSYCFTKDTRIADDAPSHGVPPFQLLLDVKK